MGVWRSPTWCAGCPSTPTPSTRAVFFNLLNPYALLGGATTLLAFLTHGAVFLGMKTTGVLQRDAMDLAAKLAIPTAVVAAVFLLWTQFSYGSGWTWIAVIAAALAAVGMVGHLAAPGRTGVRGHQRRHHRKPSPPCSAHCSPTCCRRPPTGLQPHRCQHVIESRTLTIMTWAPRSSRPW